MTELRENLVDRIIHIYGFEHPIAIAVAHLCETCPQGEQYDKCLTTLVECHEECPYYEDEDDE